MKADMGILITQIWVKNALLMDLKQLTRNALKKLNVKIKCTIVVIAKGYWSERILILSILFPKALVEKKITEKKKKQNSQSIHHGMFPFSRKRTLNYLTDSRQGVHRLPPPYPHDISYHNLVVSCEGVFPDKGMTQQCCNHPRGIASIYPLFYDTNISNKIYYTKSGEILVDTLHTEDDRFEKIVKTITSLKLTASVLRDIRHLWYLLRNVPYAELKRLSDTSERKIQIDKVIDDTNERDIRIRDKFCKQEYWNSFLKYSWFQHYFKNKYP